MVADLIQRLNIAHTFVHDLKSTFWVLLWVTFAYMPNTWSDVDRGINVTKWSDACPLVTRVVGKCTSRKMRFERVERGRRLREQKDTDSESSDSSQGTIYTTRVARCVK